VYVTGNTDSSDFPIMTAITGGTARQGTDDAFVSELNSTGSSLIFSSYYGGAGSEDSILNVTPGGGIAVASGVVYITGTTNSTSGLPLANALQGASGGGNDAFVGKITP
jgi:hypothetical protein